ncbi:PilW family protein [Massilia sp. CCM 8734]|uniref:PilW family protein n=1 Tax=Massilia sp. CCM 8734 TaxID=2609283 RepID=UPI0014211F14|nr:PilW family protein [Massilia sp. CCM 8734]NHZ97334.1 prepilin-type N-terminal cleavage/methylation domain-containing protein [Massilia sp. CCM 8734]
MNRTPILHSRGFTLVELMIAMTISLILLAGMAGLFVQNSRSQIDIEASNRKIENGRYGVQTLAGDIRNAGYFGEFDPGRLISPATMPDPCATDLTLVRAALPVPVQGLDNATATQLSCISDLKVGTDVLVIRRVETCLPGELSCDPVSEGGAFFQASLCFDNPDELASADPLKSFDLDTRESGLTRHGRDCSATNAGTLVPVRRYLTHIYFVANNDNDNDGIPTLKRAVLGTNAGGDLAFTIQPLVEGIENLQLEYGLDRDDPAIAATVGPAAPLFADGTADRYNSNPATANDCDDELCAVANWRSVVAVKLNLLARNIAPSTGYVDSNSYVLGNLASGRPNTVAAAKDRYKRNVFQSLVTMPNLAGRRIK